MRLLAIFFMLISLSACSMLPERLPETAGELESGYTYVPIDPFPVKTVEGGSCAGKTGVFDTSGTALLNDLPDNTIRTMVEKIDTSGNVSFGPAKIGMIGERYNVIVDFTNTDTINMRVKIRKVLSSGSDKIPLSLLKVDRGPKKYETDNEAYEIERLLPDQKYEPENGFVELNLPVYVGVGLRARAHVTVVGGNADLNGLGAIGAAAEAKRISGTLVVQTLGINGKSVAAALPIQSELNRTTAENAIVAVASIKTLLYTKDVEPAVRVLGFYLPLPGGKPLVNALISNLSSRRIEWNRPCQEVVKAS